MQTTLLNTAKKFVTKYQEALFEELQLSSGYIFAAPCRLLLRHVTMETISAASILQCAQLQHNVSHYLLLIVPSFVLLLTTVSGYIKVYVNLNA